MKEVTWAENVGGMGRRKCMQNFGGETFFKNIYFEDEYRRIF
jgi:hypothetical protein